MCQHNGQAATSLRSHVSGKAHALLTLYRIARYTKNWRDVWESHRAGRPIPPLQFRAGFTTYHGPQDTPVGLLHEVFGSDFYKCEPPRESAVLLDLGANIGYVSLYMLHRAPQLAVYAYEPNPSAAAILRRNLAENGFAAQVYQEAIGGEDGVLQLKLASPSTMTTAFALEAGADALAVGVTKVSLRRVLERVHEPVIWLMKMDIEGGEVEALESVNPAELGRVQNIFCEYHDGLVANARRRCEQVLRAAGFQLQVRELSHGLGIIRAKRPTAN